MTLCRLSDDRLNMNSQGLPAAKALHALGRPSPSAHATLKVNGQGDTKKEMKLSGNQSGGRKRRSC